MNLSKFDTATLHEQYCSSYPHIVIDDFFESTYLKKVVEEVRGYKEMLDEHAKREQDCIVQSKKIGLSDTRCMGPMVKQLLEQTSSPEMIKFLEKITGISNLISDPSFFGGGIHRTTKGGRLAIHADFNVHPFTKKYRRVNALLYLNDWKPSDKGELELWNKDMSQCVKRIPPIMNRFVIFTIHDTAFHGHPIPWESEDPRFSIALYYYTDDRPQEEKSEPHMAIWKKRGLEY
jgi:Rps23 Pro-64 3,4-dihydroxylase Tpa1-like proline 4-hydroxylase